MFFLLNSFSCITCWSKTWSSRWLQLETRGCAQACFALGKGGGAWDCSWNNHAVLLCCLRKCFIPNVQSCILARVTCHQFANCCCCCCCGGGGCCSLLCCNWFFQVLVSQCQWQPCHLTNGGGHSNLCYVCARATCHSWPWHSTGVLWGVCAQRMMEELPAAGGRQVGDVFNSRLLCWRVLFFESNHKNM